MCAQSAIRFSQQNEINTNPFMSFMGGMLMVPFTNPFLVIQVRRDAFVNDAIVALTRASELDLKKPLKVHSSTVYEANYLYIICILCQLFVHYLINATTVSVATKYYKKYLVRVLLNYFKKVFSTSTLRGVFQKYLVRVLNTL